MPDDIDPEEMPVLTAPPPGSGFTYSTNGPASADTRPFTTPAGQFNLPVNAQNPMFVQGPPPPDPETQMMRRFLDTIPVDQAERAIHVAQQFQARRAYKRAIDNGEDPTKAFMTYMAMSATSGGMGTKPADAIHAMTAMANLAKATRPPQMTPGQQANIDLRNREFAERQKQNALKLEADKQKSVATADQKALAESTKAQKAIIDSERRRLTARLNNSQLFQREVDITKKEMGIDDDSQAKAFVESDLNNRLKALDAQEANLGKAPVATPAAPAPVAASTATASTKTNPYKLGRIYGKPGNRLKYLGGDPMSEKSWEPVK